MPTRIQLADQSVLLQPAILVDTLIESIHAASNAGRHAEAMSMVVKALERDAGNLELQFARATVLFDWGRMHEARDVFVRVEAAGMRSVAIYLNLAWTHLGVGSTKDVERYIRAAVALDPLSIPARLSLARVLQAAKRYPEAICAFEELLDTGADQADCVLNIAACQLDQGALDAAEAWSRRAISAAPKSPRPWVNLAIVLTKRDQYDEALEALTRASDIEATADDPVESFVHIAHWLLWTGQPRAAVELCRRHLADSPNPNAHVHYAFALLTLGAYKEGWEQYEFRWFQEPQLSQRLPHRRPVWAGQPLEGRTLLLRAEQGVGDTLQFARFAVTFKERGARTVLQVQSELRQLAAGFAGVDEVVSLNEPTPAFDYYLHLMGIPRALGFESATIPIAVPYLHVGSARLQQWAERFSATRLKVGLAWAGNPRHVRDRYRSIPLEVLSSLWQVDGIHVVALQKDVPSRDAALLRATDAIDAVGSEFHDFCDTAAAIAQLDLVICVDTAIAHLAGALGKPVWLLLPETGDFRWSRDRDTSPWYPTLRIFKQRRPGDWPEAIARVEQALRGVVQADLADRQAALNSPVPAQALDVTNAALPFDVGTDVEGRPLARVTEGRHGIVQYVPGVDAISRSIAWYGDVLQPQLDLLARLLRPDAWVLEAGSGIGAHALGLARMVGDNGHLMLYENDLRAARLLGQNLNANALGKRITLMRNPLGSRDSSGHCDEATIAKRNSLDGGEARATDSVDGLLLERLDLLKVFSGDSAEILEGSAATLWRLRPILFLGVPDAQAMFKLAASTGEFAYRCWAMESRWFDAGNFNRRDTDIFDGQCAWTLLGIPEEVDVDIDLPACIEIAQDRLVAASATGVDNSVTAQRAAEDVVVPSSNRGLLAKLRRILS